MSSLTTETPLRKRDGFHLDTRSIKIIEQLDPQVQKSWLMQRSLRQSLLGYAVLDLVKFEDKLKFGTWNSRPLKAAHVQRLLTSFQQNGLERFDEKYVIPLVVRQENVDHSSLTNNPAPPEVDKLPQLKFTIPDNSVTIKCAGGRHRFEALRRYLDDLKKEHDALQNTLDTLERIKDDDLTDQDVALHKNTIVALNCIGGILASEGKWLVAVYDETSLLSRGIELAQYLSRNETKHVYMETDEERVIMEIQLLATLKDEERRAERLKELRRLNLSTKKANPLVTVVNTESAFKATELLVNNSSYFLDTPEMNVKWLYNELCGIHGGLMCAAITVMAAKLDLCLTDVVLESDDVALIVDSGNVDAIKERMSELRQAKKVEELRVLLPQLLSIIDDEWQTHIRGSAQDGIGCTADDQFALGFQQYVKEATTKLSTHVKELVDERRQIPSTLHPLIDSIPAKFQLVSLDFASTTFGLPVLTRTPLALLARHFNRIPLALQEISRWLDPLVDYQASFSKSPNSPYTQIGIDAISCYDWITKDCPADELLLRVILDNYGACLALETVLPKIIASHTPRVQTSKELAQVLLSQSDNGKDAGEANEGAAEKRRPRAKKQRPQEEAQLYKLQAECSLLVKALSAACRAKDPSPLKSNANLKIQGTRLLLHSAWNWNAISGNSRSREFRLIAGAAVLEFNIIAEYRDQLLGSAPPAVVLRTSLAAILQPYMKRLSTAFAKFRTGTAPDIVFTFADRITTTLSSDASFPVEQMMSLWQFCRDMGEDRVSVQKIVHAVEKCPLAWQDPTSQSKSPALSEDVHAALQKLVSALEMKALSHHKRPEDKKNDDNLYDVDLGITLRGCNTKTRLPTGRRSKDSAKDTGRKKLPQLAGKPSGDANDDGEEAPIAQQGTDSEVTATPQTVDEALISEQIVDGGVVASPQTANEAPVTQQGADVEDSVAPQIEGSEDSDAAFTEEQSGSESHGAETSSSLTPSSPTTTQGEKMSRRLCPPAQRISTKGPTPATSDPKHNGGTSRTCPKIHPVENASTTPRHSSSSSAPSDSRPKRPRSSDGNGITKRAKRKFAQS